LPLAASKSSSIAEAFLEDQIPPHLTDEPPYIGPDPWRIAGAFILFLSCLAGGGWWLAHQFHWLADSGVPVDSAHTTGTHEAREVLFYRNIGDAPHVDASIYEGHSSLEEEIRALAIDREGEGEGTGRQEGANSPEEKEGFVNSANSLDHGDLRPLPLNVLERSHFTIELAKTTEKKEAEDLVKQLQLKGIQAYFTPLLSNHYVIYKVCIGIFESQKTAEKTLASLTPHLNRPGKVTELR
jgi:hypothetical protein